jgi:unsaturated rhamnogalacturonyl hydrolase
MWGQYRLASALMKSDPRKIDEVGQQLSAHIKHLFSEKMGLFAHGSYRGTTIWNYWGRGNAWMALSMVDFLDGCSALNHVTPEVNHVKEVLEQQLQSLSKLQPEYGIWDVLVDGQVENKGVIETSASAGIGAAMLRARRHLSSSQDDVAKSGSLAIRAALAYLDINGVLTRTSAGTVLQLIPFGYSVIRSDRLQLWGQGLALRAITALIAEL